MTAVHRVVLLTAMLLACLAAAHPLDGSDDTRPSVKSDEVAALQPEAREEPAVAQVTEPKIRQFGLAIPELKHTQFQSFDDAGRYSFGYAYPEQVHMESRSEDGLVRGSYFYKDPNGNPNQVQYLADNDGFRVSANNLPVFVPGDQPEPVRDTPEVEEAKRKHLETWTAIAKHNEAQNAKDAAHKEIVSEERSAVIIEAAEDIPEVFPELVSSASADVEVRAPANEPIIKPLDPDVIVDEENQAVITEQDEGSDPENAALIEIDAEPIKLLAQLYAKHVQDNSEPPQAIERPAGFHPQNLQPANGFDLFSRAEGDERDAIEVTNPEFVDLRAFLLTNRFRDGQQLLIRTQDKPAVEKPSDDLYTSDQPDPSTLAAYSIPNALYNYYFGLPYDRPVAIHRETAKLPESLQMALSGNVAADGHHNAQTAPSQGLNKQKELLQRLYSPYSSFYSPYYFYRNPNPYYAPYAPHPYAYHRASPYSAMMPPYYYNNYHPYYSY